jgi:broad specificity phosphatase PhoE
MQATETMTTFLLARHATSACMHEVYVGRKSDPPLTQKGELQASAVAAHLRTEHIDLAQSSPRRRARQTAQRIVESRDIELETEEALDEIDVGQWGGESFARLAQQPAWQLWNSARHLHRAPGGEAMLDVQRRIVGHLMELQRCHPNRVVLLVTHAEVVRCALLYYLGVPIVTYGCIEVSPASIARIYVDDRSCRLIAMNERATLQ